MGHFTGVVRWLTPPAIPSIIACSGDDADSDPGAVVAAASALVARPDGTVPAGVSAAVDAANTFLSSLTNAQRGAALYSFDDPVRSNWSNLPAGVPKFWKGPAIWPPSC